MKATEFETKRLDKALDELIDLYNNLEADVPIIHFSEEVVQNISLAKKKYGEHMVNEKINTVVGEMLSWLDLDEVEEQNEQAAVDEEEPNDET